MMTRTATKFKKKGETMDKNLYSYWFKYAVAGTRGGLYHQNPF